MSIRRSLMITLAVAWFLSYADRVNMSVAAIPMQAQFGWDETTKGVVMGSVFLGYLSSQLLGGWLVNRVGAARMVGLSVFSFSVLTLLTPFAASLSFPALIAARVALGVAEGFAVPATYAFMGRWAPGAEIPVVVDCVESRRADLADGIEFDEEGALVNADWIAVEADDPLLEAVCT